MKRLGSAIHVIQKKLIVRVDPDEKTPNVNARVVDQRGSRIGTISEIFGPVKQPYIIVRPAKGVDTTLHVGFKLYVEDTSRRDDKWKR